MTHAPGELEDGSMVTPSPEFIEERKRLMSLAKRLRDDIDGEKRQRWSALGLRGPPRTVEEHLRVLTPIALDIASSLQNIVDVQRVMVRTPVSPLSLANVFRPGCPQSFGRRMRIRRMRTSSWIPEAMGRDAAGMWRRYGRDNVMIGNDCVLTVLRTAAVLGMSHPLVYQPSWTGQN